MLGDISARVGNEVICDIVGQYGVPGRNYGVNDYGRCVQSMHESVVYMK